MEAVLLREILLTEIRQSLHTVKRIKEDLMTLRISAVVAKGGVRGMIGQVDWSEVINEAKNLMHFLAKDIQDMTDQMIVTMEDIDELKDLLDEMRI